jgi:precorrin-6A/cobalt-precorrin-6A reductase
VTGAPPTVLLLGGTGEARELARQLANRSDLRVVSSLAGRVSKPLLPAGEVRIGGFGGVAGLVDWMRESQVTSVVDATHPFAVGISGNARQACALSGIPLLTLVRPPWTPEPGDDWHPVDSLSGAAVLLPSLGRRAFLTSGRQGLAAFADLTALWFLIRCVDPPAEPLPIHNEVILARGPYEQIAEQELMIRHGIDVLVTKNSGGGLTAGKLAAARAMSIPVVMIDRPSAPPNLETCSTVSAAQRWLERRFA